MTRWHILDVMPRNRRRCTWVALLIDVDPDLWTTGKVSKAESKWLYLGKHRTRRRAWNCAEKLLGHRDAAPLVLPVNDAVRVDKEPHPGRNTK